MGRQRLCQGTVVWAALEVRGKSFLHVLVDEARAEVGYLLFPQYLSVFSSSPSSCEGMKNNSLFLTELFCFVGFFPAHSLLSCGVTLPSHIIFSTHHTCVVFTLLFPLGPYISHVQLSSCVCYLLCVFS